MVVIIRFDDRLSHTQMLFQVVIQKNIVTIFWYRFADGLYLALRL